MHEEYAADSDPGVTQLCHRPCLAFGCFWYSIATVQIECQVAILTDNMNGKWLRRAPVQINPIKCDLIQLLLGRIFIRCADKYLLAGQVFSCVQDGMQGIISRYQQR